MWERWIRRWFLRRSNFRSKNGTRDWAGSRLSTLKVQWELSRQLRAKVAAWIETPTMGLWARFRANTTTSARLRLKRCKSLIWQEGIKTMAPKMRKQRNRRTQSPTSSSICPQSQEVNTFMHTFWSWKNYWKRIWKLKNSPSLACQSRSASEL